MMSTGNTDVKEEIKKTVQLIITNLNVKPSECILKNYDTITKKCIKHIAQDIP
ncbi:hypothetical protein [Vulcanisaeta sp. JCM 16159]|uniref:hypothetical protein n=1 Tax=Vulcanisaeta sp. JCM 16159 TaxID=1295371 RepID=UPI000A68329E|nr:hypothetical protein [Vulcanisaeta sp. JCM 16159]